MPKKIFVKFLILLFAFAWLTPVLPTPAYALVQAEWLDHATIKLGGKEDEGLYHDTKSDGDEGYVLKGKGGREECQSEIQDISEDHTRATLMSAEVVKDPHSNDDECKKTPIPIELTHPGRYYDYFIWLGPNKIRTADSNEDTIKTYTKDGNENEYFQTGDEECTDSIKASYNGDQPADANGTLFIYTDQYRRIDSSDRYSTSASTVGSTSLSAEDVAKRIYDHIDFRSAHFSDQANHGDCGVVKIEGVRLGRVTKDLQKQIVGEGGTLGSSAEAAADTCDAGGGFSWLICGAIDVMSGIVGWIQKNIIIPFLQVNPIRTANPDGSEYVVYTIWKNIRTVANALLVPVFFVIIFSAAINNRQG